MTDKTHTPEELAMAREIVSEFIWTPTDERPVGRTPHQQLLADFGERVALLTIRRTTDLAANLADTISSIHVERRDDALHEGNHMGALTQARNAQTADHVSKALRDLAHLKGNPHDSI